MQIFSVFCGSFSDFCRHPGGKRTVTVKFKLIQNGIIVLMSGDAYPFIDENHMSDPI